MRLLLFDNFVKDRLLGKLQWTPARHRGSAAARRFVRTNTPLILTVSTRTPTIPVLIGGQQTEVKTMKAEYSSGTF